MRRRIAALAAGLGVVAGAVSVQAAGMPGPAGGSLDGRIEQAVDPAEAALAAGRDFLDDYVSDDGRVRRLDQGDDTVSEGQAYGLLVAVAVDDRSRFEQIWRWTRAHLQRPDGLLAWRWAGGAIVDEQPAADADVLAAAALARAGQTFGDPAFTAAARHLSDAVLEHQTTRTERGLLLVAGPWARDPLVVNPSYLIAPAMSQLWWSTGDERWAEVAASSRSLLAELSSTPTGLVPDWVAVDGGTAVARAAPSGESARWSWDAARVLVQLAVDCDAEGQAIARAAWPFLREEAHDGGTIEAAYDLDGTPLLDFSHPVAVVAAAASAASSNDDDAARRLLDRADELDDRAPTYYGAAWVALARLWLDTDLLAGCPPGEPDR